MKMKTRNIILYFIAALTFCSCQDVFEPADENQRQEDAMYEESEYAYGLLMYSYGRLPYITTSQTDVATDDAVTNVKTNGYLNMATGTWSADNDPMSQWNSCRDGIQYANKFLTLVNEVHWAPSSDSKDLMFKDRLKGEALTLRAIFHYYLLMAHGGYGEDGVLYGVPLLLEPEDASSDFNKSRAPFSECVDQIFKDCDAAIELLPNDYKDIKNLNEITKNKDKYKAEEVSSYNLVFGDKARNLISAKVAMAVKAQAAVLAASPAFRDQSGVTSEKAAELCAQALMLINGLDGFDDNGNIWYMNKSKIDNIGDIAEVLWREDIRKNDYSQELDNFPPSLYGRGQINPSQNLVDAFPMRSGLPIDDPNSDYDPQNPYANRDPRLEHTILYNGTTFRKVEILTGDYFDDTKFIDDNLNHGTYSTRTGYYLKKLLRDDVSPSSSGIIDKNHCYPRIRWTEIFLGYAEAANDAFGAKVKKEYEDKEGHKITLSAYDVIQKIRKRAGLGKDEFGFDLPEGDKYLEDCAADQQKMAKLIQNERRLELCFENKRFWDIRRWKLEKEINEPVRGVYITRDEEGKIHYNYNDPVINPVEERVFDKSYQFYGPIPKTETLKWSNLQQNKGWK